MRFSIFALAVACAFGLAAPAAQKYAITPPAHLTPSARKAVHELEHHLAAKADEVPYKFVFAQPEGAARAEAFQSRYCVKGDTVYFWGDDGGCAQDLNWGDNRGSVSRLRKGTLFAVELFAERELGMRFIWAGEDGVAVRRVRRLHLRDGAEGQFTSTMAMAKIRSYPSYNSLTWENVSRFVPRRALFGTPRPTTHEERLLWQDRLRLQDRVFFRYGHAFKDWKDRFGATHAEFLNWDEQHQIRGYTGDEPKTFTKRCVSNEAVVDQIIADWQKAGAEPYMNICENDGCFWCECANCRALDVMQKGEKPLAHVTDRYVDFWNRLAKKARAIRPDVTLVTYAYSAYRLPPRRAKIEYPDNMLFGFVFAESEDAKELIHQWRAAGMKHFFLRPNYFHSIVTLHRGLERYFYNQFHELMAEGMMGCDYDANVNRPMTALEFYVMARTFADPSVPFDAIIDDYCTGYGAAAEEVKAYYAAVRSAGERARDIQQKARVTPGFDYGPRATLPRTEELGRNEDEVRAKKEMVDAMVRHHTAANDLEPIEMRRLKSLQLQAEHGLLTYRFLVSVEKMPKEEMNARAQALLSFREAHVNDLKDIYEQIHRLWWAEVRYWKMFKHRGGNYSW